MTVIKASRGSDITGGVGGWPSCIIIISLMGNANRTPGNSSFHLLKLLQKFEMNSTVVSSAEDDFNNFKIDIIIRESFSKKKPL